MKSEIQNDAELKDVVGGSWTYRVRASKPGYLDINKRSSGYNTAQECKDAKDYLVKQLKDRGYHIHLTMVYEEK